MLFLSLFILFIFMGRSRKEHIQPYPTAVRIVFFIFQAVAQYPHPYPSHVLDWGNSPP